MSRSMIGKFFHSLDAKGRLIIPSKMRECLGKDIVMTYGYWKCIEIRSADAWDAYMDKLDSVPANKESVANMKRFLRANASACDVDSQGRTLVPAELREKAGITKDVVVVGNGKKAELGSLEAWNELNEKSEYSKEENIWATFWDMGISDD